MGAYLNVGVRFNRKTTKVVTAPVNKPVSLSDMKTQLRVDTSDDDDLINGYIDASADYFKHYLRRSLITETIELSADGFVRSEDDDDLGLLRLGAGTHYGSREHILNRPNEIELPFLPIQSITSVKTFNRSNIESTFDASNYNLDEQGGRLYLNEGVSWPDNLRDREAVKIVYVAGYGDDPADIPSIIRQAIKEHVSMMYDCRGVCIPCDNVMRMVASYKIRDYLGWNS